ncbi:MAG: hypothetical protein ABSE64_12725 [Vulcanimicrobiaceae bacterium]|jgi:hypothetical protein
MLVVIFIMMFASMAVGFTAFAWAMKVRQCPSCGAAVTPDPRLVKAFIGE